jgi:hypothetical protein
MNKVVNKRKSLKRSIKRTLKRSRKRTLKRSRKCTLKRSRKRTLKRSRRSYKKRSRRKDGMHKVYELPEIKNRNKSIMDKSKLIYNFLYEEVGVPKYGRDFTREDITKFATTWEDVFNEYKILDDDLFNKLYTFIVGIKEFEASEELYPTQYPQARAEKFFEGDKVYIKGGSDDNKYIIIQINMDDSADLKTYPYIPFYSKILKNVPLDKLEKSTVIERGFIGLGGKTSFGL